MRSDMITATPGTAGAPINEDTEPQQEYANSSSAAPLRLLAGQLQYSLRSIMMKHSPPMPISKTRRKKNMAALQDLGAELVALSDDRLVELELPEFLRDAVLQAQRITGFEARRRQMQYIGKLMRKVDAEPIRARLEAWKSPARGQIAQFKRIESWRARLLREEGALADLLREHPSTDAQHLHALVRDAHREREENRPPRSYRALFQALRNLLAEGSEERGERREE